MLQSEVKKGQRVVRSKGDYVVGRVGAIVEIDTEKQRAQVQWDGETKTWVAFASMELESKPYRIEAGSYNPKTGRVTYPKYVAL